MWSKICILALVAPLVAGHGKVAVITGNLGGNGTALAILGGVVPGPGPNAKTEVDTTVFGSTKPLSDGLGRTTGLGKVNVAMISRAQALSGNTLPQAAPGGTISGVFHVVTTDGCGTIKAVLDPTATGKFSQGTLLTTVQDVPGNNGNCPRSISKKSFVRDVLERSGVITKRATNVNKDFPVSFTLPANAACSGTINGLSNVCLLKIANTNGAGPFGGTVPIQIGAVGNATAPPPAAPPAAAPAGGKVARDFMA